MPIASYHIQNFPGTDQVDLVERIVSGDPHAEEELFHRYNRGIAIIICKSIGNASVVADLCQETFIIAIQQIKKGLLREPEKLTAFLLGIARNVSTAYLRKLQNREISIAEGGDLYDRNPNQYDQLLTQEKATIFRQTLESLKSERDRQVLYRFYVEEDDKERICSDLGLTNRQFNVVLFRAKKQFEKLYRKTMMKKQSKFEKLNY